MLVAFSARARAPSRESRALHAQSQATATLRADRRIRGTSFHPVSQSVQFSIAMCRRESSARRVQGYGRVLLWQALVIGKSVKRNCGSPSRSAFLVVALACTELRRASCRRFFPGTTLAVVSLLVSGRVSPRRSAHDRVPLRVVGFARDATRKAPAAQPARTPPSGAPSIIFSRMLRMISMPRDLRPWSRAKVRMTSSR